MTAIWASKRVAADPVSVETCPYSNEGGEDGILDLDSLKARGGMTGVISVFPRTVGVNFHTVGVPSSSATTSSAAAAAFICRSRQSWERCSRAGATDFGG